MRNLEFRQKRSGRRLLRCGFRKSCSAGILSDQPLDGLEFGWGKWRYYTGGQAMKRATFTLAAVIFAGVVVSQDLPPGVLLLSRAKNQAKEELRRLENISCLETV